MAENNQTPDTDQQLTPTQKIEAKRQQLMQQYEDTKVRLRTVQDDLAAIQGSMQKLDWAKVDLLQPEAPTSEVVKEA